VRSSGEELGLTWAARIRRAIFVTFGMAIAIGGNASMLRLLLIIILFLLLLGALPTWPYSAGWGYYPSGGLGLLLIIVLVFLLVDRGRV
jgi:sterol desaturase/sphingolipid hydroxylase (fatty acid hydroxylase superfamily)